MKKYPTIGELFEKADNDPERRRIRAEVLARQEKFAEEMRQAQLPLIEDLAAAGIHVESVSTLINTHQTYPKAIPVLMKHLERTPPYPETILICIARALTVKEARGLANKVVIRAFRNDRHPQESNGVRWCLGNALIEIAQISDVDDMLELIQDKTHGRGRRELPEALVRFVGKRPDIIEVLESLQDDPDIGDRVRQFLGRKSVQRVREKRRQND